MKVGILGAGGIARKMANTLAGMEQAQGYAVASRNLEKAEAFAKEWNIPKAYGSYEEMLTDEQVDLVYVATPHSHHYEHVKLCLEHGKHVLCEKAFTVNADQAREVLSMAEKKGLLLTEAIWTRYMPSRNMVKELVDSGVIGKVTSLTANLGYSLRGVARMEEPELAGGALLDLGVYPLNFAAMVFGDQVKSVESTVVKSDKGVDLENSITLTFEDGKMAVLHSNMGAVTDRRGCIFGDKGFIEVTNINNIEKLRVFDATYQEIASYDVPPQITGYEYEVEACREAIEKGWLECPQMPHKETIRIMEQMDALRRSWDYVIPGEQVK